MKKWISVLLIVILAINAVSCGQVNKKKRYEAEFLVFFDTITQVVGYADTKAEFEKYAQVVYDSLKEYHELYDIYDDFEGINNIKTINDNAGIAPVKVDQRIIDLIKFSKEAYTKTNGQVNIALGAVLRIWHDHREAGIEDPENATLPSIEELQAAAQHTDINDVFVDEEASTVYLSDPEMSLDVGAIAKGYATEQVSLIAKEKGYTSGLLSVGGNVRATGVKSDGTDWNVGIQDPSMEEGKGPLYTMELDDLSLVTSGDYQRYYTVDGKRYHHIIDPETLMPASYFTAVSIVCKNSGMADVLSTAVFNMPYEDGKKLIESLPDTEALWVFPDGTMKYSKNFENFIKK